LTRSIAARYLLLAVRDADIDLVLGQITELLTNYGPIDIWVNDGYARPASWSTASVAWH
jgi:hypothetical protein